MEENNAHAEFCAPKNCVVLLVCDPPTSPATRNASRHTNVKWLLTEEKPGAMATNFNNSTHACSAIKSRLDRPWFSDPENTGEEEPFVLVFFALFCSMVFHVNFQRKHHARYPLSHTVPAHFMDCQPNGFPLGFSGGFLPGFSTRFLRGSFGACSTTFLH